MLRSQAFAGAEVLYRVNKLPLALAVKLLELTGTVRNLGSSAIAQLTFYLSAPRTTPFVIPEGFEVVGGSGQFSFKTEAVLTIPAGASSGTVSAIAANVGSQYNLPAYTINQITQPLAFLASVTNIEPSQGGAEAETVEAAISRGLVALRSRNPVSAVDFELRAQEIMGSGSRAKAIGLLAPDKVTRQPGAIHLFLLSPSAEPANPAIINRVFSGISDSLMLGTSLYVSPMDLMPVEARIIVKIQAGANPNTVVSDLWAAYQEYLSPAAYEPGETLLIKEVEHSLRFVAGIDYIEELQLNDLSQNIPMTTDYTLPEAFSMRVSLIDTAGNIVELMRGAGESPEFGEPV